MVSRRFVIPDIHGCAATFKKLVTEVIQLTPNDELYLLGDLIDRGPNSKGVLDFIRELRMKGFSVLCVKGNHEDLCFKAGDSPQALKDWIANGGFPTLQSFGVQDVNQLPESVQFYLHSLPHFILLDDFVLVHAGLNFDRDDPFEDMDAMLWMREGKVYRSRIGGRRIICGHTPVTKDQLNSSLREDRIMLDNGCVYASRSGLGSLTALELNSMAVVFQKNIDM